MVYSVGVIILVMVALVAFTGMCSFEKGTPENANINRVDAATYLGTEARAMDFPLRYPEVDPSWIPNSARRIAVGEHSAPTVGWVVGKDGYVQLSQTDASIEQIAEKYDSKPRPSHETYKLESQTVHLYSSDEAGTRPLRVADLGDARIVVTGAGTEEMMNDFILKVAAAPTVEPGA